MTNSRISPAAIFTGLTTLDRCTLATLLAVFEDSHATSLIADKIGTFADGALNKYSDWKDGTSTQTQERFNNRVNDTAKKLKACAASDDTLRLCLWAHIRDSFELPPRIAVSPRDLKNAANDVGAQIGLAVARKRKAEEREKLSKKGMKYWKDLADEANPFSNNKLTQLPFEDAVREVVFGLFSAVFESNETTATQKRGLLSVLRDGLAGVDRSILEDAGVEALTDDAIRKLLTKSGGLIGLMGAVDAAGFGAYILAAKASAFIPFVGGKALVSFLFVVSHPLFVFPVLFAAGALTANGLKNTVRRAFAVTVASLLAIRGIESNRQNETKAATLFFDSERLISDARNVRNLLTPPNADIYKELGANLTHGMSLPSMPVISPEISTYLEMPLDIGKQTGLIESFLFPEDAQKSDAKILSGMVLFDFLFDLSSIDSMVLDAADFSHKADLSSPFDFAQFAEKISILPAGSLSGHEANLMGYTAERIVASRLTENGHIVSIPDSATQPGFDLIVDGKEFQVKCIEAENFAILERHFEKYPDIPVIANAEIADVISERMPDWASQVFFLEGYSYEFANGLVQTSLKAGTEIGDYELLPFIATISAARNARAVWVGQQSLGDAAFNVAVDSASKGVMAVVGGFAGKSIGMLVFGPAGAYLFGGVLAVAATSKSHWISQKIDTALDPKLDEALHESANKLLATCIEQLEAKLLGIESKAASLPNGEVADAFRYRWQWEVVFVESKINEANCLRKDKRTPGKRKAVLALEFASQSGIHPVWLQVNYTEVISLLKKPKDRWKKAKQRLTGFVDNLRTETRSEKPL